MVSLAVNMPISSFSFYSLFLLTPIKKIWISFVATRPRCHKGKLTIILFAAMLPGGYAATTWKLWNRHSPKKTQNWQLLAVYFKIFLSIQASSVLPLLSVFVFVVVVNFFLTLGLEEFWNDDPVVRDGWQPGPKNVSRAAIWVHGRTGYPHHHLPNNLQEPSWPV